MLNFCHFLVPVIMCNHGNEASEQVSLRGLNKLMRITSKEGRVRAEQWYEG